MLVVRIASAQHSPEPVVIDTNQPTIVPPPALMDNAIPDPPSPLQSYASAEPLPVTLRLDQKKRKNFKRQRPKVADYQSPSVRPHVAPVAAQQQLFRRPNYPGLILFREWEKDCSTRVEGRDLSSRIGDIDRQLRASFRRTNFAQFPPNRLAISATSSFIDKISAPSFSTAKRCSSSILVKIARIKTSQPQLMYR